MEIVGEEFGEVFWRRHRRKIALEKLEKGFLYDFSSRVSIFGGH